MHLSLQRGGVRKGARGGERCYFVIAFNEEVWRGELGLLGGGLKSTSYFGFVIKLLLWHCACSAWLPGTVTLKLSVISFSLVVAGLRKFCSSRQGCDWRLHKRLPQQSFGVTGLGHCARMLGDPAACAKT